MFGCFGRKSVIRRLSVLVATTMLVMGIASAQQGQVVWEGVLRSSAGAPIAQAMVTLAAHGTQSEARTGADGHFRVTGVLAGQYKLTIEAEGSNVEYALPIDVVAGGAPAAITLSSRGEITVAIAQQKQQSATGGEELSSQAVSELPLNKTRLQLSVAAGCGHHDRRQRRHQLHRRSLPSTDSAVLKRRLPWTAPTSAIRRWAVRRSRTSMWTP